MNQEIDSDAHQQLTLALDVPSLRGLAATERSQAVTLLAQLLLEACSAVPGEDDDEDR